ncbi:MAG: electron transfer flavoprotein subunit beta/FixA family protein [Candidatus Delongbacteria bacterium]|nr:electron transfer flavoprotein subunit beta/FixA family protein [Candidatus Delongbacteria bacterium]MBN2834829.1 electron transfer flavoprotein subunit beta/FixA family protein [Candidatus Delongbacteria bacterium]
MGFKILVLAKQVPDTRNVGKDAMKADGTVNRSALPAIFNPEDLNALEQALILKDKFEGTEITILTMGPPRAADIVREGLFRGADRGFLITDRRFAGADTLATSYVISKACEKMGGFDIIISGRQAIDGDTAQVGPQVAEKLNIPQVTYAEEILDASEKNIRIKRRLERGIEIVDCPLPALVTVHSSADACRSRNSILTMKYKYARTATELQDESVDYITDLASNKPYLQIKELNVEDLNCDLPKLGLDGSPTKVKTIENVVLQSKDSKVLNDNDSEIRELMKELITNHTLG